MEAVLLGLDEAVCTRQGLLWTLTSTALRHLHVHARNFPAHLHLIQKHRCASRPLYQVGCTQSMHFNCRQIQTWAYLITFAASWFTCACLEVTSLQMHIGTENFLKKKYIVRLQLDRSCGQSPDIPGQKCRKSLFPDQMDLNV